MILEINVGIQTVSLTDGAFSMIITTDLHTLNLMSSTQLFTTFSPSMAYYHANLKEKRKKKKLFGE